MKQAELVAIAKDTFKTQHVEVLQPTKSTYQLKIKGTIVAKGKSWSDVWQKAKQLVKPEVKEAYSTIKELIVTLLKQQAPTETIAQEIQKQFPESAAAKRPSRHISWYRTNILN